MNIFCVDYLQLWRMSKTRGIIQGVKFDKFDVGQSLSWRNEEVIRRIVTYGWITW